MRRPGPLPARFWPKVERRDAADCWPWLGTFSSDGYGRVKVGGRMANAHRVAYELGVGGIPAGMQLDHLCRNRACVNPGHLEPVTARENTARGEGPAGKNARKTHCVRGHALTPDNVAMVNTGRGRRGRRCLTCRPRDRSAA